VYEPGLPLAVSGPFSGDRFWASGEVLLWWTKAQNFPPLVTVGPAGTGGIIGQPGVRTILPDPQNGFGDTFATGGRFGIGYWFDPCRLWGIDASGFFLRESSDSFTAGTASFPGQAVARPFFSANRNTEFSEVISAPGIATGLATFNTTTQLWGADVNLRRNFFQGCLWRLDGLVGYRFLRLDETFAVSESVVGQAGTPNAGISSIVTDRFDTTNTFHGGQIGLNAVRQFGRWSVDVTGKVAFGTVHQTLAINGATTDFVNGMVVPRPGGGLYALNTNIGSYSQNKFAVLPEVGFNVGYQVTQHWRVFVGYTLLYLSNVIRPGDQIDRTLNEQFIPGFNSNPPASMAIRPAAAFREADFWAQGISFGMQWRW
jgi:hypothetical protein